MKSNRFTVAQLKNVWDQVPDGDIAYECCIFDIYGAPANCDPRDMSAECGTPTNPLPFSLTVGKLWDGDNDYDVTYGLIDKARSHYGDQMADNFELRGAQARVDY